MAKKENNKQINISPDIEFTTETGPTEKEKQKIRQIYESKINAIEKSNQSVITLNKFYFKNKSNPEKLNDNLLKIVADPQLLLSAYHKLKANKGSMTMGTDTTTADAMTYQQMLELSESIKKGEFKWSLIRRVNIPKPGKNKTRPLGIPNFKDRLVQENIRVGLNAIYEPSFQHLEVNYGFRPKRSTADAIKKITFERQGMTTAIEGDITLKEHTIT
jgi:retron-type reverse transcriptase